MGKFIGTVFPLYLKELNLEGKMSIYTVNNVRTVHSLPLLDRSSPRYTRHDSCLRRALVSTSSA